MLAGIKRWAFLIAQLLLGALVLVVMIPVMFIVKIVTMFTFRWPAVAARPKNVLITGASYGLGAAFAEHYAGPGVTLGLTARSAEKLRGVQAACEQKGATVVIGACDVTDQQAMREFIERFDAATPIDLLLANAGVSEASVGLEKDLEASVRTLTDINLTGVYNTVFPAIPLMQARRSGQIALMSSLAGFGPLPNAVGYSTTKVAVKAFAYGLRGQLARDGIAVNAVCPGFVRSEMTKINKFPMPFLMDTDQAIRYMAGELARNVGVIAFPAPMYLAVWMLQNLLPDEARDIIAFPFLALKGRRARPAVDAAPAAGAVESAPAAAAPASPAAGRRSSRKNK